MKTRYWRDTSTPAICLLAAAWLIFWAFPSLAGASGCIDDQYTECRGYKEVTYLVKDVNNLDRPYSYLIRGTKYWTIEIAGVLAILGALGFAFLHGLGRYIAHRKNPVRLQKIRTVFIYKRVIRLGHWFNAVSVIILMITGFWMHYVGPTHTVGKIHNYAGAAFVIFWLAFFLYEITSFDYKQFLVDDWELREGILKQAMFYVIGIFKQEAHPYHMEFGARLNPLQKIAYFTVMFFLVPLVGFTGTVLLLPVRMAFFVNFIGMENMKFVFIFHVCGAFAMVAYLFGHLYLGTTGDKISQHYKVIFTGYHDDYKLKPLPLEKKS